MAERVSFHTTEEIHAESQRLSTHSHLRTSRDALNHGKHAGIAVYMPKGNTSKKMVETRSYSKKLFLWSNSPNFWVALRIMQSPKGITSLSILISKHFLHLHSHLRYGLSFAGEKGGTMGKVKKLGLGN